MLSCSGLSSDSESGILEALLLFLLLLDDEGEGDDDDDELQSCDEDNCARKERRLDDRSDIVRLKMTRYDKCGGCSRRLAD